jgi:hypothetical protein
MALRGYLAQVKQQSSAVAMTDEATTATGNISYQITNTAKRIIDLGTAVVVKVGGSPVTTGFTIDYLNGKIVFTSVATRTVTVTGAYVTLTTVASARSFTFNGTRETTDVTKFGTQFREFEPTLLTGTAELGLVYEANSTFFAMLTNGTIKVLEYYPNDSLTPIRFFGLCTNNSINAPVEGVLDESITFQITKQIS